jgi:hypothetical protein
MATKLLLRALRGARPLVSALAVACACARPAFAELPVPDAASSSAEVERAEALAADAFAAYGRQDFAAAVSLYRQAYDASRSADILFNIARIYDLALRERSTAMTFYQQYVLDPEAEDDRVDIAFQRLAVLEQSERAAVDGVKASVVRPAPAPTPAPAIAAPTDGEWTAWRVGAIVAGTVGLVGVGLGAGFGVSALSDARTVRENCDGDVCRSQQGLDAARAASKNADIASVSFALGGSLLAAGAAMLWFDHEPAPSQREVASLRWSASATSSRLGLALSGAW